MSTKNYYDDNDDVCCCGKDFKNFCIFCKPVLVFISGTQEASNVQTISPYFMHPRAVLTG